MREESGFTLIELLVVIIILGILLAIAVPSYLGFRDRAQKAAAEANIRAAIPSAETYAADNNGYLGLSWTAMHSYDAGLSPDVGVAGVVWASNNTFSETGTAPGTAPTTSAYCLESANSAFKYHYSIGTGTASDGVISSGWCP